MLKRWITILTSLYTAFWTIPVATAEGLPSQTSDTSKQQTSNSAVGQTLSGKVIVVDAGHGGPDSGARSAGGTYEKDITLKIAKQLTTYLHQAGAFVYMTRTTDTDLASAEDRKAGRRHQTDLRNRVRFIRAHHADMVISIHCNAANSPAWSGASTIYMKGNEDGKRLAALIQQEFQQHLLPTGRTIDDMSSLYILRRVEGPVALAEVGFLSNPTEAASLVQPAYQSRIAFCLYKAAWTYFTDPAE